MLEGVVFAVFASEPPTKNFLNKHLRKLTAVTGYY